MRRGTGSKHRNTTKRIQQLVDDNLGLAHFLARKYYAAIDDHQALSLALEGLLEAAGKWDQSNGCPFGVFAARAIKNQLNHYVTFMRRHKRGGMAQKMSMDAVNEEGESFLHDLIQDSAGDIPDAALMRQELHDVLDIAVAQLKPNQRRVIMQRYGLVDGRPRTLGEIGEPMHRTRERVRQLQNIALTRLKFILKSMQAV